MKKIIFINFLIFILILFTIETIVYLSRTLQDKPKIGFIKTGSFFEQVDDNCQRMKTHPILGHVHDHRGKCIVLNGSISNNFILYDSQNNSSKFIITLGGSTSDGFYKNFSNGKTYPFFLSQLCNTEKLCRVLNGGTGGYGSSKELLKLLTEVSSLNIEISQIISLSGINDIEGYSNSYLKEYLHKPYLDSNQVYMLKNQKWIIKNQKPFILFPNILSLFYDFDINLPNAKETKFNADYHTKSRFNNNVDVWLFNVKTMHAVSKILGAEFFVFLQPTLGLKGAQSNLSGLNGRDKELLLDTLKNESYLKNLRNTYEKLKKYCAKLSYCFDISNIASPSSKNVYNNNRHHNEKGNQIIAKEIFRVVKQKLQARIK